MNTNAPPGFLWLSSARRESETLQETQDTNISTSLLRMRACCACRRASLTLVDDDALHALFELVGGSQAFHGSGQHPLLLGQTTLQTTDLTPQHLVLMGQRGTGGGSSG